MRELLRNGSNGVPLYLVQFKQEFRQKNENYKMRLYGTEKDFDLALLWSE